LNPKFCACHGPLGVPTSAEKARVERDRLGKGGFWEELSVGNGALVGPEVGCAVVHDELHVVVMQHLRDLLKAECVIEIQV
jgi:hypothetical protein